MTSFAGQSDPVIDLVSHLVSFSGSGRDGPPARVWDWTLSQLLALLESYPGGVTEVLAQTHLHAQSLNVQRDAQQAPAACSSTLSQMLACTGKQPMRSISQLRASIAAVCASASSLPTKNIATTGGDGPVTVRTENPCSKPAPILLLEDGSLDRSMGMLLHTQLEHWLHGPTPVLHAGRELRLGGLHMRFPLKNSQLLPWLLPTAIAAVLVPDLAAAAALFPGVDAYILSQVISEVSLDQGQHTVLEGLLAARVVAPPPLAAEASTAACLWLCDPGQLQASPHVQLELLPGQVGIAGGLR